MTFGRDIYIPHRMNSENFGDSYFTLTPSSGQNVSSRDLIDPVSTYMYV